MLHYVQDLQLGSLHDVHAVPVHTGFFHMDIAGTCYPGDGDMGADSSHLSGQILGNIQ